VIYAIYLFAACIQLLYGKQGNVLVVAIEILPRALTDPDPEGQVPRASAKFAFKKALGCSLRSVGTYSN